MASNSERSRLLLGAMRSAFIPRAQHAAILGDGRIAAWLYDFRPLLLDGKTLDLICDTLWERQK